MAVIVIVGCVLIGISRNELLHPATAAAQAPTRAANWNVALGFDICGRLRPNLPANPNLGTVGIRTFGNGLVNIAPGVAPNPKAFEGEHATLGTFVAHYDGLSLTSKSLKLPGKGEPTFTSGTACTGPLHGTGSLVAKVWPKPGAAGVLHTTGLSGIRFADHQLITVAFVPKGAAIPEPASASQLGAK